MWIAVVLGMFLAACQTHASSLRGVIIDITSAGLPKALVILRSDSRQEIARQRTDVSGAYSFTEIRSGRFVLEIQEPGFSTARVQDLRVEEDEDKSMPPLMLQVEICGRYAVPQYLRVLEGTERRGRISGTVVDKNDKPVVGVQVALLCWPKRTDLTIEIPPCEKTITDAMGRYTFSQARGERTIQINAPGFFQEQYGNFYVQTGLETIYNPIGLERCIPGKCQSSLKPLFLCE